MYCRVMGSNGRVVVSLLMRVTLRREVRRLLAGLALLGIMAGSSPVGASPAVPAQGEYKISLPIVMSKYDPNAPPPTPYQYALNKGLPEDMALQFEDIPELDAASKSMIDEVASFPDYALEVLVYRPDILGSYTADGSISSAELSGFRDLDGDGVSNTTEIANGTSIFNPLETDPSNPSIIYWAKINGAQSPYVSRYQDNHMTADPLELYHTLKRLGLTDDEIILFHQHDYPVVVNTYLNPEGGLYSARGILGGDLSKIPSLESKYIDLVTNAGLVMDRDGHRLDDWLQAWENGQGDISDDLLTAYGPVVIDYDKDAMTSDAFLGALQSLPTDSNDMIYIILDGHGNGNESMGVFFIGGAGGESQIFTNHELSDALAGTQYGRLIFMNDSCYSAGMAGNLTLSGKAIAIASQWFDGTAGLRMIPKYMSAVLEANPYVSVESLIDGVRGYGGGFEREAYIKVYNADQTQALSEFFLYPRPG